MTPLKKICFLFDPNVGGTATRARAICAAMKSAGHDVRFAIPNLQGNTIPYIESAGLEIDPLEVDKPISPAKLGRFMLYWLRFPRTLWRIAAYLRQQRPDVIHVNGAFDLGPAIAGRLAGIPVVWHLNDMVFGLRLSRMLGWVVRQIATCVAIDSDPVAAHYGIPRQLCVRVSVPVDTEKFLPRDVSRPASPAIIGLVANWNWIKGQDRFVEVIHRLRQNGHNVRGTVFGQVLETQKDYWQPIFDRIARNDLEEFIDIHGFTDDMAEALKSVDVLLVTSRSESGPMVTVEAMAIGIPQVNFDVGDVNEMLGADIAGFVVPKDDIDAMTEAVARLLEEPDLYAKMAAAGPARAKAGFSLQACVDRHLKAYERAMSAKAKK